MLKKIRKTNKNLAIIITYVFITMWFRGIGLIISHFLPNNDKLFNGLLICILAATILLIDDGLLEELNQFDPNNNDTSKVINYVGQDNEKEQLNSLNTNNKLNNEDLTSDSIVEITINL